MTRRRSKLEITLDVLRAIAGGDSKPTRIMYKANLSWEPCKAILSNMAAQGCIEMEEIGDGDKRSNRKYTITEKGMNVIQYFDIGMEQVEGVI